MTEASLISYLYTHLDLLGLPTDFDLELKGYSTYYNGRYNTRSKVITLYHLDEEGNLIDLDYLLSILRHEALHHYQWNYDKNFTRVKGVMHNLEFLRLEKLYSYKYHLLKLGGGNEKNTKTSWKSYN